MLKFIAPVLLLLFLTACSKVDDETLIAARQAAERGAVIVDVRTPQEFSSRHVEGAINLPVEGLHKSFTQLDKDKEVILYCRSGRRSALAKQLLESKGYTVYDVATQADWEREIQSNP